MSSNNKNVRYNGVGLAGVRGGTNNTGTSDPAITQVVIPITIVASTAEQDTGYTMPDAAIALNAVVNVMTLEATGTTKTIDVGITSNADALIDAGSVAAVGMIGQTGGAGELASVDLSGTNITYALGATDFAELDAEIIITMISADNA